jgi:hypothetical protein
MRAAPVLVVALLAACGSDSSPDPVEVEACAHLATGPFQDLTAGPDPVTDLAIEIDDDDVAYRVALGSSGGYVFFGAITAGDYLFAMDADVAVAFTTQAGDPVEPVESATSSDACIDIRALHRLSLPVGTYFLQLSPDAEMVTIVVEPFGVGTGE